MTARDRDTTARSATTRERLLDQFQQLDPHIDRLALDLHRMPEIGSEEVHTVTRLAGEMEEDGFVVETGIGGLATAFRASRGNGRPCVALLAEYDAIPGLGHACGHNLICAAAYGAAVALGRVIDEIGGSVVLIGAPAEETFGGKVVLARRGAYDDVDIALLAHPGSENRAIVKSVASWSFEIVFEGRSSHAVAAPEQGVNALDAMVQLFVGRDALLRSFDSSVLLPGVILEGGVRPNVIPARTRARFSLRARDADTLVHSVLERFRGLVDGIARATGVKATMSPIDNLYDELRSNPVLARVWEGNARALGVAMAPGEGRTIGSLDMGALSHQVPALHPLFSIVDDPVPTHTPSFTEASRAERALAATRCAARVLALCAHDVLISPALRDEIGAAHRERVEFVPRAVEAPLVTEQCGS